VKFDVFRASVALPYFTTSLLRQRFPDIGEGYLALQLTRWCQAGKLAKIRKGLYAFGEIGAGLPGLANEIVAPSYLSGLWALGHYGMIPEAVWEYTSVCRVCPRRKVWQTPFGRFSYRQVKFFSGYERVEWDGLPVLLAVPEKALCDEWYLAGGEWTVERHWQMRYQQIGGLNEDRLGEFAAGFRSLRMDRVLKTFFDWRKGAGTEEIE
jgi:hypothetical protein